jgi:hypothetical protein
MAKKKSIIKRIVTKSGEARYYANGKRVKSANGRKKFIKQNPNVDVKTLTDKEKSYAKRVKNIWKFKNLANVPYAYVDILTKLAIIDPNNVKDRDLYNVFENGKRKFNSFDDIKREIDEIAKGNLLVFQWCNEVGLPNYRGRDFETFTNNRIENIVDIVNLINSPAYKKYRFIVIDRDGDMQLGHVVGLLALRDFEIDVGSTIQSLVSNSAYIRFCYDYTIDYENKEITIDLTDMYPNKEPDPTDPNGGFKSLLWYVNNAASTGAKEQLIINDKYKDVEIRIEFS